MKNKLLISLVLITLLTLGATTVQKIQFYTDYPNSVPVGSDFWLFQRNNDYINASVSQVKQDWFNNPVFSGNGGIQGVWTATTFVGDGSQLTGIRSSATNTITTVVSNNIVITTNITVNAPGGFTNLNLTPLSAMVTDANDAEAVTPNAPGVYTNNGAGRIGWSTTLSLTELDAQNFYPTNTFLKLTNDVLSTDGNGQITNLSIGTGLSFSGNTLTASGGGPGGPAGGVLGGTYPNPSFGTFSSATLATALNDETGAGLAVFSGAPTLTNTTIKGDQYGTNAFYIDRTGATISNNLNQVVLSNGTIYATGKLTTSGETNSGLTASQFIATDGNKAYVSTVNGNSLTNLTIQYNTNAIPSSGALTFGQAYFTNLQASVTLANFTLGSSYYETIALFVTNSTGSDTVITPPVGVAIAKVNGNLTCTNKSRCMIYFEHYGTQVTNAWKNDF